MNDLYVEIINNFYRFAFVLEALFLMLGVNEKNSKKFLITVLYCVGYSLMEGSNFQSYIWQCIYTFFILILIGCRNSKDKMNVVTYVCIFLLGFEIINLLGNCIGVLLAYLLENPILDLGKSIKILTIIIKAILILLLLYYLKTHDDNFQYRFKRKYLACFTYVLVICIKIPFLYTSVEEAKILKMVIVTMICCTVIFLIISRIERRNAEMERAKIENNNKELSTKLHKSQEIIPAMVQVLSNVAENSGTEMEEEEKQKLLNEVTDLFGQQLKENSKEDLQLKNFCSTGLKLLDQQLRVYQMEAVDRNVNLDIFVQAPINDIIKKDSIDQLKLQRAVGDLIRNAFRVMEREDKKCRANGHILLIIGCQYEDILEIAVVDNGEHFPLHVIEAFGRRGVTTGGTGNGLADLVEFAEETKASICVEEFDGKTNSFMKRISIIFDKRRMNYFISPRKEQVTGSFWNYN